MNEMMKKAQELSETMKQQQEELAKQTFKVSIALPIKGGLNDLSSLSNFSDSLILFLIIKNLFLFFTIYFPYCLLLLFFH